MFVIDVPNVNYALHDGLLTLGVRGYSANSRVGPVRAATEPVTTVYRRPEARVFFHPTRDANPFFHLFEALWMLSGSNDLASMTEYVARFAEFSDDGEVLHGAYGFRWREWFNFDQLPILIDMLKSDPKTRRAVLTMWSPNGDMVSSEGYGGPDSKDLPCNTQCYFSRTVTGGLDMTVCNRSNDIVWGAYGANAVHFSMLQEWLAGAIGCGIRFYWQVSNNYHCYSEREDTKRLLNHIASQGDIIDDRYATNANVFPMWEGFSGSHEAYTDALKEVVDGDIMFGFNWPPFLQHVISPMLRAWRIHKAGDPMDAKNLLMLDGLAGNDWHIAGREWLQRRADKKEKTNEVR